MKKFLPRWPTLFLGVLGCWSACGMVDEAAEDELAGAERAPFANKSLDVVAQVSSDGLRFIGQELKNLVPKNVTFPDSNLQATCLDVTFAKIQGEVTQTHGVTLSSVPGKLSATLNADVKGSLQITAKPCIGPTISCKVVFNVVKAGVTGTFVPALEGGKIRMKDTQVAFDIRPDNTQITVPDCGVVSSIADFVIPKAKQQIIDGVGNLLKGMALQSVPAEVEKALGNVTSYSGKDDMYSVNATLSDVAAMQTGLSVGVDLALDGLRTAKCFTAVMPTLPAPSGTPAFAWQGEELGVALSEKTIADAILAMWRAGDFCMRKDQQKANGMTDDQNRSIGALLGFRITTVPQMEVHAHKPPTVKLYAGTTTRVEVKLTDYTITIEGEGPNGATTLTGKVDVMVSLRLELDPVTGALIQRLNEIKMSNLRLTATDPTGLVMDAEKVLRFSESVAPMVVEPALDRRVVLPQVVRQEGGFLDPYYLYIARTGSAGDYALLYGRFFKKPVSDTLAPTTTLSKQPPKLTTEGTIRFEALGTDDKTPGPLLRYSWSTDGKSWSKAEYDRSHSWDFKDGKYTVQVKAVDLNGNEDKTPTTYDFEVDGKPPTLAVTQQPPSTLKATQTIVTVKAEDDRSPADKIGLQAKVEFTPAGETTIRTLNEGAAVKGLTEVKLDLPGDGDYRVTLVAVDEAGNLSKTEYVTFRVEGLGPATPQPTQPAPTKPEPPKTQPPKAQPPVQEEPEPAPGVVAGCSAAPVSGTASPSAGSTGALLFLGLALLALRRLRRAR
ncbi:MAG: hypothetical protein IT371_16390 [Deltaproteobacteria bacterium]|nr:hypothetical protein [Deltaproteobacteria bacterium]